MKNPEQVEAQHLGAKERVINLMQKYNPSRVVKDIKNKGMRILAAAAVVAAGYGLFEKNHADSAQAPFGWSTEIAWADNDGCPNLPFANGKYQTFPRWEDEQAHFLIDLGTLGPDVDTIFGLDFEGNIPTGALAVHMPAGEVLETRVVGIKRTDLETIQFQKAKGGDRFDVYQASKFGGDECLDKSARRHAQNTARPWQKVIYIGDLGLFETQWGDQEQQLLQSILRAQRPGRAGIIETPFVNPRVFQ